MPKLTKQERLILSNQYELLKHFSKNEFDHKYYEIQKEVVDFGFESEYDNLFDGISESVLTKEEGDLVINALFLYSAMLYSYRNLENIKSIELKKLFFPGFDGNNEAKYKVYARFQIYTKQEYSEVAELAKTKLESHTPMVPKYKRMIECFDKNFQDRTFTPFFQTEEEILQILNA